MTCAVTWAVTAVTAPRLARCFAGDVGCGGFSAVGCRALSGLPAFGRIQRPSIQIVLIAHVLVRIGSQLLAASMSCGGRSCQRHDGSGGVRGEKLGARAVVTRKDKYGMYKRNTIKDVFNGHIGRLEDPRDRSCLVSLPSPSSNPRALISPNLRYSISCRKLGLMKEPLC